VLVRLARKVVIQELFAREGLIQLMAFSSYVTNGWAGLIGSGCFTESAVTIDHAHITVKPCPHNCQNTPT